MIELVIDADHAPARELAILDVLSRCDRADPVGVLPRRADQDFESILLAVPDLELVLRDVHDAVAEYRPLDVGVVVSAPYLAAGVDAAHDVAEVARMGRGAPAPAFPAATETHRPGTAIAESIQRLMARWYRRGRARWSRG